MRGFQNSNLNQEFRKTYYNRIVCALIEGCKLMVEECNTNNLTIQNHEEIIRSYLLENFLENDSLRDKMGLKGYSIRFIPEVLENYDKSTNTYVGRTDIKVVSNDWFKNRNSYYIVECKRIDGTNSLNRKFVTDGIRRFTDKPPKYLSYYNCNIMLGFLVKSIDCNININKISDIHNKELGGIVVQNITITNYTKEYYLCESKYDNHLMLNHIFYDLSSIISNKKRK